MADWKKLLVENPPASDIASSPSSGKVLKVSSNGTGLEWGDASSGAFSDNGTLASVTDRIVTITGSSSAIPTLDINPPSGVSGTSYSRIRVQTSGRDLRFNLRNGSSTSDVMTIAHNNKVGIGTSSPSSLMHIQYANNATTSTDSGAGQFDNGIRIENTSIVTGAYSQIRLRAGTADGYIRYIYNNINQGRFGFYTDNTNNVQEMMTIANDGKVGIGTTSPTEKLHVAGNILLNVDANSVSHKLRLTGASTSEIYTSSYDAWWTTSLNHYLQSRDGFTNRNSDGSKQILFKHDINSNHYIGTTMSDFQMLAGHAGALGFFTSGGTTRYKAIQSIYTDNNTSGLKFNTKASGTDTERMRITSAGLIGIGTTSPTAQFHVNNTSDGTSARFSTNNTLNYIHLTNAGGANHYIQTNQHGLALSADENNTRGTIQLKTSNTTRLNVTSDGKIGIGTTSPNNYNSVGNKLVVADSGNSGITIASGISNYGALYFADGISGASEYMGAVEYDHNNNRLKIWANADTDQLVLTNNGKVGIGTNSPQEKLDISAGNIRLDNQQLLTFATTDANSGRVGIQGDEDSDWLRFRTDNGNRMAITSIGVGINTLSPTAKLHVVGTNDNNSGQLKVESTGTDARIHFVNSSGDSSTSGNADILMSATSGYEGLRFMIDNSDKMIIDENGRIGIGTTAPTQTVDIRGQFVVDNWIRGWEIPSNHTYGRYWMNFNSGNPLYRTGADDKYHKFQRYSDEDVMVVGGTNKRVGIGTSSPSTSLHVIGGDGTVARFEESVSGKYAIADGNSFVASKELYIKAGAVSNNHIYFQNSSSTNMALLSNGNLGIGTTLPSGKAHIFSGSAGGSSAIFNQADELVIENSDHAGITIKSPANKESSVFFGDADDSSRGGIRYNHDGDTMTFQVASAKLILDLNSRISLSNNDNGSSNTVFGYQAGNSIASGSLGNALFGESAGAGISTNDYNTFIGNNAGRFYGHASATKNTAVGYQSMYVGGNASTNSAFGNTALGYQSLYLVTTGSNNVSLGYIAGDSLTTGSSNVIVGSGAGVNATTQSQCVLIGADAGFLLNNNNANGTIAIGYQAGYLINQGINNTVVGKQAMKGITTGDNNIAIGALALGDADAGVYSGNSSSNIAIGSSAMGGTMANITSDNNIAIGTNSLSGSLNGVSDNIGIGTSALENLTTGDSNIAIGLGSLRAINDDGRNIGIGAESLKSFNGSGDTYNVAIGHRSQYARTGGVQNTALGAFSQYGGITGTAPTGDGNTSVGYATLHNLTSGAYNAGFGIQAGYNNKTGVYNHSFGYQAGYYNETGSHNTAVGGKALFGASGQSHSANTAVGYEALKVLTTGASNVALGSGAGLRVTSSSENILIGRNSGAGLTTGYNNTYIGHAVASHSSASTNHSNTFVGSAVASSGVFTGAYNVGMGRNALLALTSGQQNSAVGNTSLSSNTSGNFNSAFGYESLRYNQTGTSNTALGHSSQRGASGNSHTNNTSVGHHSLYSITTGGGNTAIGKGAGDAITTDQNVVAIGYNAYSSNDVSADAEGSSGHGSGNIAIGYQSMESFNHVDFLRNTAVGFQTMSAGTSNASQDNVALGYRALQLVTDGDRNVALGAYAGKAITSGTENIAIGKSALLALTTGNSNVAIGQSTMSSADGGEDMNVAIGYQTMNLVNNDDANHNIALGYQALQVTRTTGSVAIGNQSLKANTSGEYNTAIGYMAGKTINSGYSNTIIGYEALLAVTGGYQNVAIGHRSGNQINTGDSHVLIGYSAGTTLTDGRRCTVVGDESDVSASGALNQTVIGQGATGVQDNSAIIGNSACADVFMGDNGSAWSTTSDGRLKENIEEWSTGLDAINKLRIVEYNFKEDNPYKYDHKKKRQGIIAQEAIEAIPEMIKDDGEWLTANQEPMIWALVNAVKELTKKVNILETKLNKEN